MSGIKNMLRAPARALSSRFLDGKKWRSRQYGAPSPDFVKRQVLLRNSTPHATWVETGTFLGETTKQLAKHAQQVYSVEPEPDLYRRAVAKFSRTQNVEIVNGTSESVLPKLLPRLTGAVNFWLDGHYSAGVTFQGDSDTPIVEELAQIERHAGRFTSLSVLVDDVRCFNPSLPEFSGYPSIDFLVDWARRNTMAWHIEHDIFVARR